jgi:acetyl-CoA carboxylase biotin carboxyl carrier protein
MEVKDIRRLLDILANTDVSELTLETGEYKLTVRRGPDGVGAHYPVPAAAAQVAPQPQPHPAAPATTPDVATPAPGEAPAESKAHLSEVTAPIVGTFYSAPSPDTDDYVKVGDRVERGTVLCIIEAMKLMNEIEAETAGTIAEVLVRNEEPVEYGQVLFRIDPR